jgi:hypothetical protein
MRGNQESGVNGGLQGFSFNPWQSSLESLDTAICSRGKGFATLPPNLVNANADSDFS